MTRNQAPGETEARVLAAIAAQSATHGPVVSTSCSSVWSFGVRFSDGHNTRFVLPKDSAIFRAASGAGGLEAARTWVRSLSQQ